MIPFAAAIPVLIAIAVIPPVLAPDSDPIQFLQGIIPSIQVACAQPGPLCFLVEPMEAGATFVNAFCENNGCEALGGTCVLVPNNLPGDVTSAVPTCECRFPSVGGWFLQVDQPAILLAGAQMTAAWMIPAIVSAIGIGIVIARKF